MSLRHKHVNTLRYLPSKQLLFILCTYNFVHSKTLSGRSLKNYSLSRLVWFECDVTSELQMTF